MTEIDARGQRITSLVADFEQRKFTALLRRPLVSGGRVRVKDCTVFETDTSFARYYE